jgi:hypothetical protein
MIIIRGPSASDTKYGWICILLDWTNSTRHDLITRNIWPKPEITTDQELNIMPMHAKPWGTEINSWKSHGTAAKSKNMGRVFNKTNNSEINIYCSNNGSINHQLQSIPFHTCLHKSKHRRT